MGEKQGRWDVPAAERWEPYEARVSRTVLRGPGGAIPPGYSLSVVNLELRTRTTLEVELAMAHDTWCGLNVAGRRAACAERAIPQHRTGCADQMADRLTD